MRYVSLYIFIILQILFIESEDRQLEYQIGLVNVEENKTDNHAKIFILDPIEKLTVWEEG